MHLEAHFTDGSEVLTPLDGKIRSYSAVFGNSFSNKTQSSQYPGVCFRLSRDVASSSRGRRTDRASKRAAQGLRTRKQFMHILTSARCLDDNSCYLATSVSREGNLAYFVLFLLKTTRLFQWSPTRHCDTIGGLLAPESSGQGSFWCVLIKARNFTHTVPHFTHQYQRASVTCWAYLVKCQGGGLPVMDQHIILHPIDKQ